MNEPWKAMSNDETTKKWVDLMNTKEDLHPDLVGCVVKRDGLPTILQHPYVIEFCYTPQLNAWINYRYVEMKATIERMIANKKWDHVMLWIQKPYKFEWLLKLATEYGVEGEELAKLFGDEWAMIENSFQCHDEISELIEWHDLWQHRESMMDERELDVYRSLPDELTIYRGCREEGKLGYSWTMDRDTALMFARRFPNDSKRYILTATIHKSEVLMYQAGRSEAEIVVRDPLAIETSIMEEVVTATADDGVSKIGDIMDTMERRA